MGISGLDITFCPTNTVDQDTLLTSLAAPDFPSQIFAGLVRARTGALADS